MIWEAWKQSREEIPELLRPTAQNSLIQSMPVAPVATSPSLCSRCRGRLWLSLFAPRNSARHFRPSNGLAAAGSNAAVAKEQYDTTQPLEPRRTSAPRGRVTERMHAVSLSTPSLGSPVEVVMLRTRSKEDAEAERWREELARTERKGAHKPLSTKGLVEMLDAERMPISDKAVQENIDRFRPQRGEVVLPWEEYNALAKQLEEGFTAAQLEKYVRHSTRAQDPDTVHEARGPERNMNIRPWRPILQESSGSSKPRTLSTKERAVARLLRQSWHLQSEDDVEQIGRLHITVAPWEISLLLENRKWEELSLDKNALADKRTQIELSSRKRVEGIKR